MNIRLKDREALIRATACVRSMDITLLLLELDGLRQRIEALRQGLKQFKEMETIVAPDGRRWPLGTYAASILAKDDSLKETFI